MRKKNSDNEKNLEQWNSKIFPRTGSALATGSYCYSLFEHLLSECSVIFLFMIRYVASMHVLYYCRIRYECEYQSHYFRMKLTLCA